MMDVVIPVGERPWPRMNAAPPFAGRARSYGDLFEMIGLAGNRSNT